MIVEEKRKGVSMLPALTEAQALIWTQRMIAVGLIQQSVELLSIRRDFGRDGVWSWMILRGDFNFLPKYAMAFFDWILADSRFIAVIALQLILAIASLFFPVALIFFGQLLTATLICLRWRGTFNGGSDFMTLIVLTGVVLAGFFGSKNGGVTMALIYIALHSVLSYWVAGAAKFADQSWRSGKALRSFLKGAPSRVWVPGPRAAIFFTFLILVFECSFPLAILRPESCFFYMIFGLLFHTSNALVLGLNRFILPWAATYPALWYLSQFVSLGV